MPGPASSHGHWRGCSWRVVSRAGWPARGRRGTSPNAAVRSISCSPWSLLPWRSICWRVTYRRPGRRPGIGLSEIQMNRSKHPAGTGPGLTRRKALLLGAGAALVGTASRPALAQGDGVLTEALVLRDPDVPSTGNPEGDVNIVEWFDYNCPYC